MDLMAFLQQAEHDVSSGDSAADHQDGFGCSWPVVESRLEDMVDVRIALRCPFRPSGLFTGADGKDQVLRFEFASIIKLHRDFVFGNRATHGSILDVQSSELEGGLHVVAMGIEKRQGGAFEWQSEQSGPLAPAFAGKALEITVIEAEVVDRRRPEMGHSSSRGAVSPVGKQSITGVDDADAVTGHICISKQSGCNVYAVNSAANDQPVQRHDVVSNCILDHAQDAQSPESVRS